MKWSIDKNVECPHLIAELDNQKIEYSINEKPGHLDTEDTIYYGNLQFINEIPIWASGKIFCNYRKLNCLYYMPRLHNYLLNQEYVMLPFAAIEAKFDQLTKWFGKQMFIRPASASKAFTGSVLDKYWLGPFKRECYKNNVQDDDIIVIAPYKVIGREWRVVVTDHVICGSEYWQKDYSNIQKLPENVTEYVNHVLKNVDYKPDPIWVIDVCEHNNSLSVVEVNSFACSGLYGCDPKPIIEALNELQ